MGASMSGLLVNPRNERGTFLARLEGTAALRFPSGETTLAVRGELLITTLEPLSRTVAKVVLQRFALYGLGGDELISGLGVTAHVGRGLVEPTSDDLTWHLSMPISARANYDQLQPELTDGEPPLDRDYVPAPSVALSGNVSLHVRLDVGATRSGSLRLIESRISLSRQNDSSAELTALRMSVRDTPIYSLAATKTPLMVLPVRPIVFPLKDGTDSGTTFDPDDSSPLCRWNGPTKSILSPGDPKNPSRTPRRMLRR
jgi:hypothetical protein